ncbi:MAG: DNA repair protein RecO [Tannerellaceae bacterium]|jgi:DNA repair protein RecO (recombination protein O)|nr:DNA repair protein RecO [Tannerellaceae bacterium]
MQNKTRGIVLQANFHNDRQTIVDLYTDTFGRISCVAARRKGKHNPLPKVLFMPLMVVEMEIERRSVHGFFYFREAGFCFPLTKLVATPVKSVQALFLAEVLSHVLKETEPNVRLFDFLYQSIHLLEDAVEGVANFHLAFLFRLLSFLGISPNADTFREGSYFDMRNGVFVPQPPLHKDYLDCTDSRIFFRLFRIRYENMSLYTFSRRERVNILQKITAYYRLHLPLIREMKSLPILQSLFD